MTVSELIAQLQQLPPNNIVVQAKDGEGNGFSPVAEVAVGLYAADTTWSGEFWTPDAEDDEKEAESAVCLWPIN
jgi:hypothetical protein